MRVRVRLGFSDGLHGGPAARLVAAVAESRHQVHLGRAGDPPVDAGNFLALTGLEVRYDEELELTVTGPRSDEVTSRLVALIRNTLPR